MEISARSALMAGVAAVTATAVVMVPTVQPLPPQRQAAAPVVHIAQEIELLAQQSLLSVLQSNPLALLGPAAPVGSLPAAPTPTALAIAPNLANTIDNVYITVEPWVRYGFEVATAVVRWIPYVGWFAGQIMVFYNFFESMVASGVFNFTDFLRGDGGVIQNLVDFGVDVGLAFVWLGLDELAQFVPLPPIPLPPRPPLQGPFLAADALLSPMAAAAVTPANAASNLVDAVYIPVRNGIDYGVNVLQAALAPIPVVRIVGDQASILWNTLAEPISNSVVFDLIDPVLNQPLNINSYLNGAYDVGATTVNSVLNTGAAELNYFLGGLPGLSTSSVNELDRTAEVSSVPSIVKSAPPVSVARNEIRNVRNEIRDVRNVVRAAVTGDADDVDNSVVKNDGPVVKTINDIVKSTSPKKTTKIADAADDVAKAPKAVVKGLQDTAKKLVKDVRNALKNSGHASEAKQSDTDSDK